MSKLDPDALEVGMKVGMWSGGLWHRSEMPKIVEIERLTKTQITAGGIRFTRTAWPREYGKRVGRHSLASRLISYEEAASIIENALQEEKEEREAIEAKLRSVLDEINTVPLYKLRSIAKAME